LREEVLWDMTVGRLEVGTSITGWKRQGGWMKMERLIP